MAGALAGKSENPTKIRNGNAYPPVAAVPAGAVPAGRGDPGVVGAGIGMTGIVDPSSGTDGTEAAGVGAALGATVTVK